MILRLVALPGHDHDTPAERLHQRRVVGRRARLAVRGAQRGRAERLRRLHRDQASAVGVEHGRTVDATVRRRSITLIVSVTSIAGMAASAPSRTAAITRS